MGVERTIKNMALFGLMIFAMFSFMFTLQNDNPLDGVPKLIDDPLLNDTFNNLNLELGAFQDETETQNKAFDQESPSSSFGELTLVSIVSIGRSFNGLSIGLFNVLVKLPATALGISPVVYTVIGGILILSLLIGLWLLIRANPKQ